MPFEFALDAEKARPRRRLALERKLARVRVLDAGSPWFGMTYPADRPRVEQAIQALVRSGVYPERLWG